MFPGHERFVRNMLAGVGGIDLVLLVISADESIKPQTREHFDICRLLSVRRGITVLTKSDLVDRETLEVVRHGSRRIPERIVPRSGELRPSSPSARRPAKDSTNCKRELARLAAEVPAKDSTAAFRLPIDRVFSMKGFGTVVTGTLIAGSVAQEQEVEVHPAGKRLRVRGVQVHGETAEQAIAGQRTALNLAGVETADLARGMMLTDAGTVSADARGSACGSTCCPRPSRCAMARGCTCTPSPQRPLPRSSCWRAKLVKPGESGYARLKLDDPLLLLPGDRFIIRQFSPVITIGGGRGAGRAGAATAHESRRAAGVSAKKLANATPEKRCWRASCGAALRGCRSPRPLLKPDGSPAGRAACCNGLKQAGS